jgi:hypothetical protein
MSAIPKTLPNGAGAISVTDTQEIYVAYDQANNGVTVTPDSVVKNTRIRFVDPNGGQLRVVFLAPDGKEVEVVPHMAWCTMSVGGTYHFKCYFTPVGYDHEISPTNGGVIDVMPRRP